MFVCLLLNLFFFFLVLNPHNRYCTRLGRFWDHTHEKHFACSPPVSRLITFPPTSWLLLPWQAGPPGKVRSDAAHPVISTPHRLRTSEIPMPKSVSSAVTHRKHHRPALPFRDWLPFTKPVLILAEEISSTFVPRGYAVLYPISRSGTSKKKSPPPSVCVLLCFINPRVRRIRKEASSCPGIFSRTLRFYYVASSPVYWGIVYRLRSRSRSHTFYFQVSELFVGPDVYRLHPFFFLI